MRPLTEWLSRMGWLAPEPEERHDAESAGSPDGNLAPKLQRLAELQEELLQIERLPVLAAGAVEAGAPPLPPAWLDRALAIEAEMEQLRLEIAAGEAEARPAGPRASEAVGCRILEEREAAPRPVTGTRPWIEGAWPELEI